MESSYGTGWSPIKNCSGNPKAGETVAITSSGSFRYFECENLTIGQTHTVGVNSRRYRFAQADSQCCGQRG